MSKLCMLYIDLDIKVENNFLIRTLAITKSNKFHKGCHLVSKGSYVEVDPFSLLTQV